LGELVTQASDLGQQPNARGLERCGQLQPRESGFEQPEIVMISELVAERGEVAAATFDGLGLAGVEQTELVLVFLGAPAQRVKFLAARSSPCSAGRLARPLVGRFEVRGDHVPAVAHGQLLEPMTDFGQGLLRRRRETFYVPAGARGLRNDQWGERRQVRSRSVLLEGRQALAEGRPFAKRREQVSYLPQGFVVLLEGAPDFAPNQSQPGSQLLDALARLMHPIVDGESVFVEVPTRGLDLGPQDAAKLRAKGFVSFEPEAHPRQA
jgi:hypothetical protein